MRARSWVRSGLIFLAVGEVVLGGFAYLGPRNFYNDIPTVAMDPPFSQHFVSDIGAFFVAQGVMMAAAAIIMEHRLVRAALASYLTFAVLHLAFHASHLAGMPRADAIGLVIALSLDVVVPAAMLIAARPAEPAGPGSRWQPLARGGSAH
jgi:hypothetical protein